MTITPEIQRLVDVALLMAQELQEFVDDACDAEDDDTALASTQELLADWEEAYQASGITARWQDILAAQDSDTELDL